MAAVNVSAEAQETTAPTVTGFLGGDPLMLGLPSFLVGAIALGMTLVGVVPGSLLGATLPIVMGITAIGQFVTMLWCIALGDNGPVPVFALFAGFWASLALLVLGLAHGWYGLTPAAVTSTQEVFLSCWLIAIVMLTLATLRMPLAFTGIFFFVDLALLFNLLSVASGSSVELKIAGVFVFVFSAIGVYCFFGQTSAATGGKPLPLGRPIIKA